MSGGGVAVVLLAALVLVPGWFVVTSWSRGRFGTRDRLAAAVGAVQAGVAGLLFQHVAAASVVVPLWLWAAAVILLAVGVAGIVLRWPRLPGLRPGTRRRPRAIRAAVSLAVSGAIVILVLASR